MTGTIVRYNIDFSDGDAMDIEAYNDQHALEIVQALIEEDGMKPERVYRYGGDEQIDIYPKKDEKGAS